MKLKTYFSVIKELLTCSHCLICVECIVACCWNWFQRSICILESLRMLVTNAMSHDIMYVPLV